MTGIKSWRSDKRKTSERGYGHKWQKARALYLSCNPLCVMCHAEKRITAANTVDHKLPHKGNEVLFWDQSNWQSLCAEHHNSDKQAIEKSGRARPRIGQDGYPIDEARKR
jgi:5-methylcytosine-specific restriction endonuclease McrA